MAKRKDKRARRSGLVDVVNAVLTLLVIALLVAGGLVLYGIHGFYSPGPIKQDTDFVVDKGANLGTVAEKLEAQGLIDNRYVFEIGGLAAKKQRSLKAGEFKLTANASMADILKELTEGKPIEHSVTIPEGFTMAQVVDRLNKDTDLTGTLTDIPPEGGVLPQTYTFQPGVARQSILDQMVAADKKKVAEIWAARDPDLPLTGPDQLVTLASMVEKETGVPGERAQVAAVFVNRLKKHMRLQSDPTIIYGITKGVAPLGRPLKRSEVEAVTPYNTYQVDGLPPTPIDNPGADALKAAANPAKTNDIYFVAATTDPADGHLFSSTYADHRKNVAKLRVLQKKAAAEADADAAAAMDQIDQQQAAAAGDQSAADTSTTASDAGAATPPATATAPAAPAPTDSPAAAPSDAPVPMPISQRPPSPARPAARAAAKPTPLVLPSPGQTGATSGDGFGG